MNLIITQSSYAPSLFLFVLLDLFSRYRCTLWINTYIGLAFVLDLLLAVYNSRISLGNCCFKMEQGERYYIGCCRRVFPMTLLGLFLVTKNSRLTCPSPWYKLNSRQQWGCAWADQFKVNRFFHHAYDWEPYTKTLLHLPKFESREHAYQQTRNFPWILRPHSICHPCCSCEQGSSGQFAHWRGQ